MKNRFLIPFKQSRSTKSHKPPSPNLSNTTPDLEWHKEHDAALTCLYSHTNTLQTPIWINQEPPYPNLKKKHINPMLKLAKLLISVTLRCSTFLINYPSYSSHQWCWSSSVMAILWRILHSIFFGFEFNNFHRIEWRMFWNLCFSTLFDWFLNDKTCLILFHWHGW